MNVRLAAGFGMIIFAAGLYVSYTRPARLEAQRLMGEYARSRRELHAERARIAGARRRQELWAKAVTTSLTASAGARSQVVALRARVLDSLKRADIDFMTLDVQPAKPPLGASARIVGRTDFARVARLLEALDPQREALLPALVRLDTREAASEIGFSVQIDSPQ